MAVIIKSKLNIDKNYTEIRKKEINESIILEIMNDSEIVFPSEYEHIEKQDHSESDFIDVKNNFFYDAKILFDDEMCINLRRKHISNFVNGMQENTSIDITCLTQIEVEGTKLYNLIKERINKLKDNEFGILFLPFPIFMCSSGSIFSELFCDQFDLCIKGIGIQKPLYLIGLNIYGEIVCKEYYEGRIEYLKNKYFDNMLNSEIIDWEIENGSK